MPDVIKTFNGIPLAFTPDEIADINASSKRMDNLESIVEWTSTDMLEITNIIYGEHYVADLTSGTLTIEDGADSGGKNVRTREHIPVEPNTEYCHSRSHVFELDASGAPIARHTGNTEAFTTLADTVALAVNIAESDMYRAFVSKFMFDDADRYVLNAFDVTELPDMQANGIVHHFVTGDFTNGTLSASSPYQGTTTATRKKSNRYYRFPKGTKFSVDISAAQMAVYVYALDGTYIESYGFTMLDSQAVKLSQDSLVRLVLSKRDNSAASAEELQGLVNAIIIKSGTDSDTQESSSNRGSMRVVAKTPTSFTASSMTVIDGKLYVFPYASAAYDDHSTMLTGGVVYDIASDGSLVLSSGTFSHNMGHGNSVDYNPQNGYLVGSNGGGSANTQPNEIYLFPKASELASFDIDAADSVRIDVSQEGWGKQLNCCWAWDNSGYNDMIWCLTNYQYGNMISYDVSNYDPFDGSSAADSRRFIRLVLLGRGTVNLGSGTMIAGKSSDEFNGTYKVVRTYELPFNRFTFKEGATAEQLSSVEDANNDLCFHDGMIWETTVHNQRQSWVTHAFTEYGDECVTVRHCSDNWNPDNGKTVAKEGEGMAIHNGYMYQYFSGSVGGIFAIAL